MWSGSIKLKGHGGMPSRGSFDADHMAALLLLGSFVDEKDRLADLDLHAQFQQPAMRVDHDRLRFLAHLLAVPRPGLHDHWNLQHYALAAPPFCWISRRHFSLDNIPHYIVKDLRSAEG